MRETDFEAQIKLIASGMDYPPTPNIAGSVTGRLHSSTRPRFISKTLTWSLTLVVILILSVLLIPPVRAAVLELIQIGVITIFPQSLTPIVEPTNTSTPETLFPVTAAPALQDSSPLPILKQFAGATTLIDAQKAVDYSILLPTYPPNLGKPDLVFVQDAEGAMTILVWLDPQQPEKVIMSLHFIPSGSWAITKMGPQNIQETRVNGQYAVWAEGPYPVRITGSNEVDFTRLIEGHVLIWDVDDITYRLETGKSLEEAIKIAESLQPVPSP